jgi:hypothetical protein
MAAMAERPIVAPGGHQSEGDGPQTGRGVTVTTLDPRRGLPNAQAHTATAQVIERWRAVMIELDARDAEARRTLRELRLELSDARLTAERSSLLAERDRRAAQEAERREVAERAAASTLREENRRLEDELAAVTKLESEARAEARTNALLASARRRELTHRKAELKQLRAENRQLATRARRLDALQASRSYKLMRFLWRVKGVLLWPPRATRRLFTGS